ncbi:hypothetical protein, partial [Escherichia coli]
SVSPLISTTANVSPVVKPVVSVNNVPVIPPVVRPVLSGNITPVVPPVIKPVMTHDVMPTFSPLMTPVMAATSRPVVEAVRQPISPASPRPRQSEAAPWGLTGELHIHLHDVHTQNPRELAKMVGDAVRAEMERRIR